MRDQRRRRRWPRVPAGSGLILLGEAAARIDRLDVACNHCGRLGLDRLVAEHGPDLPMPELLRLLSADRVRRQAGKTHDPCGVHFPQLPTLGL